MTVSFAHRESAPPARAKRIALSVGIVTVLVVAVVGVAAQTQGWRSRIPTFDNLTYIDGAQQLARSGYWPDRGILTSFGSYTPPGVTWLMLPGVVLFDDPRLYEVPGSAVLYIGTLAGIFVLARMYVGIPSAILAVILYGVSALGLSTASSLWPRYPLPFFYVWMVYFASRWAIEQQSKYLAAALMVWTVGMYVFLEIAPAIFILPVVWVLYHPPVTMKTLAIVAIATAVVWFPYLRFENSRDFIDVKSQVQRTVIVPANYTTTWCNPRLLLRSLTDTGGSNQGADPAAPPQPGKIWRAAVGNFEYQSKAPRAAVALLVLVLIGSVLFAISGPRLDESGLRRRAAWRAYWLPRFGAAMILLGIVGNEFVASRYLSHDGVLAPSSVFVIRLFQLVMICTGVGLLLRRKLVPFGYAAAHALESLAGRSAGVRRMVDWVVARVREIQGCNLRLLVTSMIVPWVVLYLVIENAGRVDRIWWIWPLQVIVLAASVVVVPKLLRIPNGLRYALVIVVVAVVADARLWRSMEAWSRSGWSGADADEVRVIDYVARQLGSKRRTAIGYQEYIWRFEAEYNVMDPRYKVGADFDVLLKNLHGVTNTNQCAEGVSPPDEFRVVQTQNQFTDLTAKGYFEVPADARFKVVQQIGPYQVLKRN